MLHLRRRALWSYRILIPLLLLTLLIPPAGGPARAQGDLAQLVRAYEATLGKSAAEQHQAAIAIFQRYDEYKHLAVANSVSRDTARALDEHLVSMCQDTWRDVAAHQGSGLSHIVPVGTLGNRWTDKAYIPGKSDKDFIPRGLNSGEAARDFSSAFEKQWGIPPGSVDVNALDPTDIKSWPDRVIAAADVEKYNTKGGIAWLENDLYKRQPNLWVYDPGTNGVGEVAYGQIVKEAPPALTSADAAGLLSDSTRFRQQVAERYAGDYPAMALKQAKYDLRNADAYLLAGGQLTETEQKLLTSAKLLRDGEADKAISAYMASAGIYDVDEALRSYLEGMDNLTARMARRVIESHVALMAEGKASLALSSELSAAIANLPPQYAGMAEEVVSGKLGKAQWQVVSQLATAFREQVAVVRYGREYFDAQAMTHFGRRYDQLSDAQRAVLHGADEAAESFAGQAFKAAGMGLGVLLAGYAIYEAYQEGARRSTGVALGSAVGRAMIELLELGYPPLIAAELLGRLAAGVTNLGASAYKNDALESIYARYRQGEQLDYLLNTQALAPYFAGGLRQLAIEMREQNPQLTDEQIAQAIRDYFVQRLAVEQATGETNRRLGALAEWVDVYEIPLRPGGDAYDNDWLKQHRPEEYFKRLAAVLEAYERLAAQLRADGIPFNEDIVLGLLEKLYRGGRQEYEQALRELYRGFQKTYPPAAGTNPRSALTGDQLGRLVNARDVLINATGAPASPQLPVLMSCLCGCACAEAGWACGYNVSCNHSPAAGAAGGPCLCGGFGEQRLGPATSGECFTKCSQQVGATIPATSTWPLVPIGTGTKLKAGDQIFSGNATDNVVVLADGSQLLLKPDTVLTLLQPQPGIVRVHVQKGGFRLVRAPGGTHGLEVQLGNAVARPVGTELLAGWADEAGSLAVVDGAVTLTDAAGTETQVSAGQQVDLPSGALTPYDLSQDDGGPVDGLRLRDLLLDDTTPQPCGEVTAAFGDDRIPADWVWQDPGQDAHFETPAAGTLRVTVPDGNELWGGWSDAPRLLHRVTGDFDLQGELFLESQSTDLAASEFVLFAPAAGLGSQARQMLAEGFVADYRIVGGGWLRQQGLNKLQGLETRLRDGPDAPDHPVRLRLTRRGDLWKTYWSLDGQEWTLSGRQRIEAPNTLWVGWVFKRMAYDGLVSEPAITTLSGVRLTSAARDTVSQSGWDLDGWQGRAFLDGDAIELELDGSRLASVRAFARQPLAGDFDVVARFETQNWQQHPGEARQLMLEALSGDDDFWMTTGQGSGHASLAYVGPVQHLDWPFQVATDWQLNGGWGRWQSVVMPEGPGWLRLARYGGQFETYVWSDCEWLRLDRFTDVYTGPVMIALEASNLWEAQSNAALTARVSLEQFSVGEPAGAPVWAPEPCSLLAAVDPPPQLVFPAGLEASMFQAPYALGSLFTGNDGTVYLFSSQPDKQKLMVVDRRGQARTFAESEALAGVNGKGGVWLGQSVLMTIDYAPDGGNPLGGLFQLWPGGAFREWKTATIHGGLSDIIAAPGKGWYFADFENDNIWHLTAEGAPETPVITQGDVPGGLVVLAYDARRKALYALNRSAEWPWGGTAGVYQINEAGEAVLLARPAEGTPNFGGMAFSPGLDFDEGLYVSDPEGGSILQVAPGGSLVPVVTGLPKPGALRFDPATGALWVVCDATYVLRVGSPQAIQ